jgi:pantoate--beta-alanine ligase
LSDGVDPPSVIDTAKAQILAGGFDSIDYLELRTAALLEPVSNLDEPARLLVAAWIGGVRLIDNVGVPPRS